jgi:16S rRNA (cytosine967-C5)-methyltransferase
VNKPDPNRAIDDVILGGARKGRLGRITDRALNTLAVIDQGVPADRALSRTIKTARDLGSSERRALYDLIYGLMRNRRRVQYRLMKGMKACGKKIDLFDDPVRLRMELMVALLEQGYGMDALQKWDSYAYKRVPKLFEKIAKSKAPIKDFAVRCSLPAWMANRLCEAHGDETAEAWAKALLERAPLTVRVNSEKVSRDEMLVRLREKYQMECKPTDRAPHGIIILQNADLENSREYLDGELEIQDEGSQLIIEALNVQPGHNVLDTCAGAGGKTLGLAALLSKTGKIVAVDIEKNKLAELKKRAKRVGLMGIKTLCVDLIDLPARYIDWADRVLIDAPCSGTGRLRRQPDSKWRMTEADLLAYPSRQFTLLSRGVDAAKPGGVIVYATCSIMREENDAIVERILDENKRVQPLALSKNSSCLPDESWTYIEPGPTSQGPDGFFIAAFTKI